MAAQQQFFPLRGGLDQETPAIAIPPGRVVACLNHESTSRGYQRTEGYERFDGQDAPSSAEFYTLTFEEGATAFVTGTTITGYTSGATARVLDDAIIDSGTVAGGDAVGTLPVHLVTGEFVAGELLRIGSTTYARLVSAPELGDWRAGDQEAQWSLDAADYLRSLITAVPGSGPVRGVVYYGGKLNAWRDNADASRCVLHHSSASGWDETDLGHIARFVDGVSYEVQVGDTLTGDSTGATATVRYVVVDSGAWEDGDAAGYFILDDRVGTISDETVSVGANEAIATVETSATELYFVPGGSYEFEIFNFFATESYERVYGCGGVGAAFEFDGDTVVPINTGMEDDRPIKICEHKNHLFLAFRYGSLQHSRLGQPRQFDGRLGAAELGMGHEITNLIPNTADVLLITTEVSMSALTGNDSSDWNLAPVAKEDAGAIENTAQRIGQVVYLDNRGVRSAAATQLYANFKIGAYTNLINRELANKRKAGIFPVASCVLKSKDQYLLFFDDGSGVSLWFGAKNPEAMLFKYPFVVSCKPHVVEIDGVERVFVGATDGFVYELNKGTSFDGDVVEAFIQLPFHHNGDPRLFKRYTALELEVYGQPGTELGVIPQFSGGDGEQPLTDENTVDVTGGGGLWGIATWGDFIWSAPQVGTVHTFLDGAGFNMGPIIVSRQAAIPSYTVAGATVVFRGRGHKR